MKGSIRQLTPKSYQLQIYTGEKGLDGKPQRYYETVRSPRRGDAQKRLNELLVSLERGVSVPTGKLTVAKHLNQWLEGYVKTNCSERTHEGYASIIRNYLTPAFGNLTLKQLTPQTIQLYYGSAVGNLSNRTVHHQHRVLSESLKYAVRQGNLGRNPCDLVDPPRPVKKNMRTMTPGEVEHLLEVAKDSYFYPIIYFAVSTGLRKAEILGLRWRDIDLDML